MFSLMRLLLSPGSHGLGEVSEVFNVQTKGILDLRLESNSVSSDIENGGLTYSHPHKRDVREVVLSKATTDIRM